MEKFLTDYAQMNYDASKIIALRTSMMATGLMAPEEATEMVLEKVIAMMKASGGATVAMLRGRDPVEVANVALEPYRAKTSANVRRLFGH